MGLAIALTKKDDARILHIDTLTINKAWVLQEKELYAMLYIIDKQGSEVDRVKYTLTLTKK